MANQTSQPKAREIQKLKKRLKKDPSDEEAFVKLWDVFAATESWDAAAELLRHRIQALDDPGHRLRSLLRLGSLYDERLGDMQLAVEAYKQAIDIDPSNRRALWALSVLYHDLEDWERVIEVYLRRIRLASSLEEKLSLRSQLAQIYEQRLEQEDQALIEYIRAARMAPQNVRILLNLETLATRTESFRELLAVYEDVVERIEHIELRVALYLKLARLYSRHLEDDETGTGYYRRALELAANRPEMLFAISTIYGEAEEWLELISTYTRLIELAEPSEVKSRLRREIARLYRRGLGDPTSAFYELVRVARYDPGLPGLSADLFDLGIESERQLELAAVAEDICSKLTTPQLLVDHLVRLARLYLDEIDNPSQARKTIDQAIEQAPESLEARLVRLDILEACQDQAQLLLDLDTLLSAGKLTDDMAAALRERRARTRSTAEVPEASEETSAQGRVPDKQQLREDGRWEELCSLLAQERTSPLQAYEHANLVLEMAEILEKKLGREDRAFFELLSAIKLSPDNHSLLDEAARLARQSGFIPEFTALVDDVIAGADDSLAASLQTRLGLLFESERAPDQAVERYQHALDLDGTQPIAYQKLRSRAENHDLWTEVIDLDLRRASQIDDPEEKTDLLVSAADNLEHKLGKLDRAFDIWERVLKLDPGSKRARLAVEHLRAKAEPAEAEEHVVEVYSPPRPPAEGEALPPEQERDAPEPEEAKEPTLVTRRSRREDSEPTLRTSREAMAQQARQEATGKARVEAVTKAQVDAEKLADDEAHDQAGDKAQRDATEDARGAAAGPACDQAGQEAREQAFSLVRRALLDASSKAREDAGEQAEREARDRARSDAAQLAAEHALEQSRETARREAAGGAERAALRDAIQQARSYLAERAERASADHTEPGRSRASLETDSERSAEVEAVAEEDFEEVDDEDLVAIDDTDVVDIEEEEQLHRDEKTVPGAPSDPTQLMWQAARRSPSDPAAWEKLANHLAENDPEAAFSALEEGVEAVGSVEQRHRLYRRMAILAQPSPLRLRLAKLLENADLFDEAESSYRAVLRSEKADPTALDGLYRIYSSRKALERYEAILSRTIKSVTDPAAKRTLLLRRARLRFEQLDREQGALEDLEQLILADDSDIEALSLQEEILERYERYDELVKAYQAHLPYCMSREERVDLLVATAILYENQLDNPDQAVTFYRLALEENPRHTGAMESAVALQERRRDWLGAIDMLRKIVDSGVDSSTASRIHFRTGKILEEQLLRPEEAEESYRLAIIGEFPSTEALASLKGMARRRGDWVEVIRLGKIQVDLEPEPSERASLLVDLARAWRDRLDNEDKALECYELALSEDPDNVDAAHVVAELRLKAKRHAEAHALLEKLADRSGDAEFDQQELASIHLKLAQSAEALDRLEQAGESFARALELAPTDQQILTQFGYYLARRGQWGRAVDLYRRILTEHRQHLDENELANTHCLLAQGYSKLERIDEAATEYRRALEVNPKHLPALRASIEIARQLGRWEQIVELLERLKTLSPSPASRQKLSLQIGDILSDSLDRHADAARSYREALKHEPNNVEILEKLRKVLVKGGSFKESVEVLEQLAHLVTAERQRARYLKIAGDIERERLDDDQRALQFYLRALDAAPLDKRTHSAAVKILNRMRDWRRLAKLYEDLLRRLPPPIAGHEDRRVSILTELVELYRYRLDDRKRAIQACEQLLTIVPGHLKIREDLARLYEAESEHDRAIQAHRSLIAESPFSVDSYHALRRIYENRGDRDKTLCMSATLAFLDEASKDELAMLKAHRHALPLPPDRRMNEEQYARLLLHSSAGGLLGEMISYAADHVRSLFVTSHRDFKLRGRDRVDLGSSDSKVAEVLRQALVFLSLPPPEVYSKGVTVKGILAVNTSPPAILFSEETVRRATISELRFMCARALAFTRPENLLGASMSPRQLRILIEALVELALPGIVGTTAPEVVSLVRKLDHGISRAKRERLVHLASRFREQSEDISIRDWLEGVEHTCNRAGLVLSGDLEAAITVLKSARVVSPSGSSRSLIRELIFYSISDSYFSLREELHASI